MMPPGGRAFVQNWVAGSVGYRTENTQTPWAPLHQQNPAHGKHMNHDLLIEARQSKLDATGHKKIDDALRMDRGRAGITLDSIGDAVLCIDLAGKITYLNAVAEKMTGWSLEEARGRPHGEVFQVADGTSHQPQPQDLPMLAIEHDKTFTLPHNSVIVRRDGSESAIEDSVAPIHERDDSIVGAVVVFRDASAARAVERRLSHRAQHDFLTGLPNPVLLNDRIAQAISMARRYDKELAVLFIDLDHFKDINDSLGHAIGDQLLQSVALRLKASVRDSDAVSRKGGDEFVVLLSEIAHAEHAAHSAQKIIAAMAKAHKISGHELLVTASIGIGIYPIDGPDAETLLESADQAMYQAKKTGRNNYCFFRHELNSGMAVSA